MIEVLPTGHLAHWWCPDAFLYVPLAQGLHTPPSGPVNPLLHTQGSDDDPEAMEFTHEQSLVVVHHRELVDRQLFLSGHT